MTNERRHVLKHAETFAIFDRYGDMNETDSGEEGLYHEGTRFLSILSLRINGVPPVFLSSSVRDDNDQLTVSLTNPDLAAGPSLHLPLGSVHIGRRIFLLSGSCYQEVTVENFGRHFVPLVLTLSAAADYKDIYEIRGMSRKARGSLLPATITGGTVSLGYLGLDGVSRHTDVTYSPGAAVTVGQAAYHLHLEPRKAVKLTVTVSWRAAGGPHSAPLTFSAGHGRVLSQLKSLRSQSARIQSSNSRFQAWMHRAESDLHMMTTELPTGPYPYAGVPWFNAPFGRDGIITAFECLWYWPELARGVLSYLAAAQATAVVPEEDAEPGKIVHETRKGEMAALKEMPFGRYYGSVDGTLLFVVLAGAYYRRTGDLPFIRAIWPNIHAALGWISQYGDTLGDGLVRYHRQSGDGLIHQGWRDADDAVFHADGSPAEGAIAACEVQAYAYGAWIAAAELLRALVETDGGAGDLEQEIRYYTAKASWLRQEFSRTFWIPDLSTFALALDGTNRPCRVRCSSAGHSLLTGLASRHQGSAVVQSLMQQTSFSGWGVRTIAASEAGYNPMAYHNGSVWPHDNALIASGMSRYGYRGEVLMLFQGMYDAAMYFDLHRMPELFCGFARQPGEGPVSYPVACSPQSWSAASVFLFLQSALGLSIDGVAGRVTFVRPKLPSFIDELRVENLRVAGSTLDLLLVRRRCDVSVKVLDRRGDAEVLVVT